MKDKRLKEFTFNGFYICYYSGIVKMTKKSLARQMRDKQAVEQENFIKENTAWDDINEIYQGQINYLNEVLKQIKNIYSTPMIFNFFQKDKLPEVVVKLKALNSDAQTYTSRIEGIHKNHENKKGGIKETEEFMLACQLSEEYSMLNTEMVANLTPSYNTLIAEGTVVLELMCNVAKERELAKQNTEAVATIKQPQAEGQTQ